MESRFRRISDSEDDRTEEFKARWRWVSEKLHVGTGGGRKI
jgi:hypothetical protein